MASTRLNREETKKIELKEMVQDILENNGEIRKLRANLQLKILDIVRGGDRSSIIKYPATATAVGLTGNNINSNSKTTTDTITIINQMIMEYFQWIGYQYTAEMYQLETNTTFNSNVDRIQLEKQLGLQMDAMQHVDTSNSPMNSENIQSMPILLHIAMNILADKN